MSNVHIFFDTPKEQNSSNPENTVILLGVAEDGPVHQLCKIRNYKELVSTFGVSSLESAYISMNKDLEIYAMRVNGSYAYVDVIDDIFTIYSSRAGSKYNGMLEVVVKDIRDQDNSIIDKVIILRDKTKTVKPEVSYSLYKYNTVSKLCEIINKDNTYGVHNFTALDKAVALTQINELANTNTPLALDNGYDYEYASQVPDITTYISNIELRSNTLQLTFNNPLDDFQTDFTDYITYVGLNSISDISYSNQVIELTLQGTCHDRDKIYITDGIKDALGDYLPSYVLEYHDTWHECITLKEILLDTYNNHLYNVEAKAVILTGVYFGNSVDYMSDLANYCYDMNKVSYSITGIMSAYKKGNQALSQYVAQLIKAKDKLNLEDRGSYTNIIAGEVEVLNPNQEEVTITLEGALGSLLATHKNSVNPTNKVLLGDAKLTYDFKEFSIRKQNYLDILAENNINCPYLSIGRGVCLYKSVTMANNLFSCTKYTRIGQEIVRRIKDITNSDIGENITTISAVNLNTKVTNALDEMIGTYIEEYSYSVERTNLYEILINVEFVPIGDIDNLSICITL